VIHRYKDNITVQGVRLDIGPKQQARRLDDKTTRQTSTHSCLPNQIHPGASASPAPTNFLTLPRDLGTGSLRANSANLRHDLSSLLLSFQPSLSPTLPSSKFQLWTGQKVSEHTTPRHLRPPSTAPNSALDMHQEEPVLSISLAA
jgi:hypothetical protein